MAVLPLHPSRRHHLVTSTQSSEFRMVNQLNVHQLLISQKSLRAPFLMLLKRTKRHVVSQTHHQLQPLLHRLTKPPNLPSVALKRRPRQLNRGDLPRKRLVSVLKRQPRLKQQQRQRLKLRPWPKLSAELPKKRHFARLRKQRRLRRKPSRSLLRYHQLFLFSSCNAGRT